ncbi:unannotated protein [freshwater metagenome]|uniref:Unannotated protein n=1 Tax=freshwater metagenome TaxID=449393 RepID=A0A6J6X9Z5_9ZZZZ
MQRTVLTFVVGTFDDEFCTFLTDGDLTGNVAFKCSLGTLHGDVLTSDGNLNASRYRDRSASYS